MPAAERGSLMSGRVVRMLERQAAVRVRLKDHED
jgi:ribosomal protein L35AE/L33A